MTPLFFDILLLILDLTVQVGDLAGDVTDLLAHRLQLGFCSTTHVCNLSVVCQVLLLDILLL